MTSVVTARGAQARERLIEAATAELAETGSFLKWRRLPAEPE